MLWETSYRGDLLMSMGGHSKRAFHALNKIYAYYGLILSHTYLI